MNRSSSFSLAPGFPHHVSQILVVRGGAIGDFILTLPVFSALRKKFPSARIEILGYPRIAQLALPGRLAEAVQPIESPELASFFVVGGDLNPKWTSYFAKFDLIVSYAHDPKGTFGENVKRCSKAQFIIGPHRPNETESVHATEVFLKPLSEVGIANTDPIPKLGLVTRHLSVATSVAVHPGSGSERKNWPEEKWSKFLQWLCSNVNAHLLLIGGEAEGEKLNRLAAKLPASQSDLAQNLPLVELAGKLSGAGFFLGHDSGITHLAAALGLPGVILWGQSNFAIWRPRSETMKVLQWPEGLSRLPMNIVIDALENHPAARSFFA